MSENRITISMTSNRFPEIAAKLPGVARQLTMKAALDIEARAKELAPVRTGNLKNSIQAKPDGDTDAIVIVGAEYGIYVEMGGRHNAAHPFFNPAVEAVAPGFVAACRAALGGL